MNFSYIEVNDFLIEKENHTLVLSKLNNDLYDFLNNEIHFKSGKIFLNDDKWDLRYFTLKDSRPGNLLYDFSIVSVSFQAFLKLIIYKKFFIHYLKPGTIKESYFNQLVRFCKYLNLQGINTPSTITKSSVEKFMGTIGTGINESTKLVYRRALISLFEEFENHNIQLDFKGIYKYLKTNDDELIKLERELGKTDLIPENYYKKMLELSLKEVRNPSLNLEYKEQAAIVLLLSQLGCRIGELRLLEIGKKETFIIKATDEKTTLLYLQTYKTVKSKEFVWTKSFLTKEGEEAYDFLSELALKKGSKEHLFLNSRGTNLYEQEKFRGLIFKFVLRNYKELKLYMESFDGLQSMNMININSNRTFYYLRKEYLSFVKDDTVYYPLPHQFRVNVANELYRKGIHLDWIREHMNHLSSDMTIHYLREIENKEKSVIIIKEFIQESLAIDEKVETSALYKKIDRFINANNYTISVDFEELIKIVKDKKPIREKSLGYCIKSGYGRACPQNLKIDITERTDTHIPSCEFLNLTYERFKNMNKVITYNDKNGFVLEKERETKRLKLLINNYLLPEINELKDEIDTIGIEEIKIRYPHLTEVIDNLDKIYIEVKKCA